MRIRRRFTGDLWSRPPHKRREYLPVLPPPDGVSLDRPADNSTRVYRTIRIPCAPERLAEGARVFGNLLGFYTAQIGALGTITQLDGETLAVLGIRRDVDGDCEIMVELEDERPVPVQEQARNIFDFTEPTD